MKIPKGLGAALWSTAVAVVVAVAGLVSKDVLIQNYIVPVVVEELESDGFIRQSVAEGRFVATDQKEFSANVVIPDHTLIDLKDGQYVHFEKLSKAIDPVRETAASASAAVSQLQQSLADLDRATHRLQSVVDAEGSGEFDVTLYISNIEDDRGHIVLNSRNAVISHFLRDGSPYVVSTKAGNRGKLPVRLEPTTAPGKSKDAAIGRMHRHDYHLLFKGAGKGIGRATVHIPANDKR